ncbi:energy-coupling factor transporter transmembrane component T [Rossellomorea sp. AcN35-11]|nr:energy-coupling factor transporter transmembrane protein EcfT [Rossellomorea aquimaris]WJV28534.1 energy-coupling factor transporter transmembrane component T [Rossellomorea sp. AcN35-11]
MNLEINYKDTWLHHLNPSFKLLALSGVFLFILFVHHLNWLVYLTLLISFMLWFFSGLPRRIMILMILPFLFVFLSTSSSMILFGKGETIWLKWGLIQVTEESFYRGIHVGVRAFVFAVLGLLFVITTKPVLLFYSLMQQMKVKPKYAYSFMAAFRLIPIMAEEIVTIRNAMKVRGIDESRNLIYKMKCYMIPLLAQSIRKAHRIAVAMETKGFKGEGERSYYYRVGFSRYDGYFVGSILLIILVSLYASIHLPIFPVGDVRHER